MSSAAWDVDAGPDVCQTAPDAMTCRLGQGNIALARWHSPRCDPRDPDCGPEVVPSREATARAAGDARGNTEEPKGEMDLTASVRRLMGQIEREKHLDSKSDTDLLLRRFDRVERDMARDHRDLELLSEAVGRYMRLWFTAHAPSAADAGKGATRSAAESQSGLFAKHLGAQFKQGHRFIDDFPLEAFTGEDHVK